jgi:hypothetical protein
MGSGVLKNSMSPNTIFDMSNLNLQQQVLLDGYSFDGQNIYIGTVASVSDLIEGVHLTVTLSDVSLAGAETTRVAIFGISFGDELIHDDLEFKENGTQITRGRYKEIKGILFSNFAGNLTGSRRPVLNDGYDLIGNCLIKEAEALETSFDHVIASQVKQPSKYFNSFTPGLVGNDLTQMLQDAIGNDQSVADLNIGLASLTKRTLSVDDVTTRIGQKFLATGSNIQKMSILLSVLENTSVLEADAYNWSGSIILTLHELQTDVFCPVSPVPDNAVDFDPNPAVVAQLTLDADMMEKQGIVLGAESQIVNFIFTSTKISDPIRSSIEEGKYYIFTIGRSGDTGVGTIQLEEAPHRAPNGYMVVYDGSQWVNVRESDMWFSIEGDYVKVTDGIAYEDGIGVQVPKIAKNNTNTEVPYVEGLLEYTVTTKDAYNYLLLDVQTEYSDTEQDQQSGNEVLSRAKPSPLFSMITSAQLISLLTTNSSPVLGAMVRDQNPRGNPATISGTTTMVGAVESDTFHIINPDADIRTFNLVGSLFQPDTSSSNQYRIIETTLYIDSYGDINGDGEIDSTDLNTINSWITDGYNFDLTSVAGKQQILNGYATLDQILRADVNKDYKTDSADSSLINDFF